MKNAALELVGLASLSVAAFLAWTPAGFGVVGLSCLLISRANPPGGRRR